MAFRRAETIISSIGIHDQAQRERIKQLIAGFYVNLHDIHEKRDAALRLAEETDQPVEKIVRKAGKETDRNHKRFVAALKKELTPAQTEAVKDGLTYSVLPRTYQGYMDMLPSLTEKQKSMIMEWLVEAREIAMDGGSSDEKHAIFGKYKGKINNYLSSEGYDLKKAGEDWQKRIREQ